MELAHAAIILTASVVAVFLLIAFILLAVSRWL
jgi:hypothetical protein